MPVLNAMVARLDGLIAEDAIIQANAVAIGAGTMKDDARETVLSGWRRAMRRGRKRERPSNEQIAAMAAAAGLTVVRH